MKFIKINEDMYINVKEIQGFAVHEVDGAYWVQAGVAGPAPINLAPFKTRGAFWVEAGVDSPDPINIAPFETREAARAYLAELVAKLNGDDLNDQSRLD